MTANDCSSSMAEAGTEQGVAMAKKTVTREVHQKMYGEERDKMVEATTA